MNWTAIRGVSQILLLCAFLLLASFATGESRKMAIVAGDGFPIDRLTLEDVRDIYLGEIQILNRIRVYPIDQSHRRPIRTQFLGHVLHMKRDYYIDYWNKRLYRKGGFTPLLRENSQEIFKAVREQEGAIGYVWLEETQGEEGIKTLLTIESN